MPGEFIRSEKWIFTYWMGHLPEDSAFDPSGGAKEGLRAVCKASLRVDSKKLVITLTP